jgi:hypothetical protein
MAQEKVILLMTAPSEVDEVAQRVSILKDEFRTRPRRKF